MRLILVRHAQSLHNLQVTQMSREEFEQIRNADPDLTPLGLQQADLLGASMADYLAELDPAELVIRTSPMLRTLQTARPLLTARRVQSLLWRDIHEHGGLFVGSREKGTTVGHPGITPTELLATYPEFTAEEDHAEDGWWNRDAESDDEFQARVGLVADALRTQAEGTTDDNLLLLVSHGTFLGHLLRQLVTEEEAEGLNHHHNTAFSELLIGDGEVTLLRHDVTDHLTEELLSI